MRELPPGESVRVHQKPREPRLEVPVERARGRAHLALHLDRQLPEVVGLVPNDPQEVPNLVAPVLSVPPQILEQPRVQARDPPPPPERVARRVLLQLGEQQRAPDALAVLHLDAVGDGVEELEARRVAPPEGMREGVGDRRTTRGVAASQPLDQIRRLGARAAQIGKRARRVAPSDVRVALVRSPERVAAAGQAVVEEAPERERVHRAALALAKKTLGGEPTRGPAAAAVRRASHARRAAGFVGGARVDETGRVAAETRALGEVEALREAHVRDLPAPARGDEDVLGLQVPVRDAPRVKRVRPREHVAHEPRPERRGLARRGIHDRRPAGGRRERYRPFARAAFVFVSVSVIVFFVTPRPPRGGVLRDAPRERFFAPLQRDVHEIGVLLHGETPEDVRVFVRGDERGELGARELVELREQALHRDGATVELPGEHDRPARTVPERRGLVHRQAPHPRRTRTRRAREGTGSVAVRRLERPIERPRLRLPRLARRAFPVGSGAGALLLLLLRGPLGTGGGLPPAAAASPAASASPPRPRRGRVPLDRRRVGASRLPDS